MTNLENNAREAEICVNGHRRVLTAAVIAEIEAAVPFGEPGLGISQIREMVSHLGLARVTVHDGLRRLVMQKRIQVNERGRMPERQKIANRFWREGNEG